MPESRADVAERITRQIEEAVTGDYPGEGLLGVVAPGQGFGRMFVELPHAMQWKELNERVDWTGLTAAEKGEVIGRALRDVREKVPEEIHPATWFDGILLSVDPDAKVYDLGEIIERMETPDRGRNLDERVCERARGDPPGTRNQQLLAQIRADAHAADTPEARLLNELRGMEETLLGNHRRYARLREEADQLGISPPIRTASQIVAEADGFPQGTPPLPPSPSFLSDTPGEMNQSPSPGDIAEGRGPESPGPERGKGRGR